MENICPYCQEGPKHKFLNQRIADLAEKEVGYLSDFTLLSLNEYGRFDAIVLDEEGNPIDNETIFVNFCSMCGRSLYHEASSRWGVLHEKRRD